MELEITNSSKVGHYSRKDRVSICGICDNRCEKYKPNKGSFSPRRGHRVTLVNPDEIYMLCLHYPILEP